MAQRLLIVKAWDREGTSFSVWETTTPEIEDSGRSYRNTYPSLQVFQEQLETEWDSKSAKIIDLTHLGLAHLNMKHDEILKAITGE